MRIHWPIAHPGRPRLAYVEFEDEESMKAGLEKHAEVSLIPTKIFAMTNSVIQKLKDTVVEVKQATDRESRGETPHRGGPGGRGRGRGSGGYAARGFAAAGLTRGGGHGFRGHSDAGESPRLSAGGGGGGGGDAA